MYQHLKFYLFSEYSANSIRSQVCPLTDLQLFAERKGVVGSSCSSAGKETLKSPKALKLKHFITSPRKGGDS